MAAYCEDDERIYPLGYTINESPFGEGGGVSRRVVVALCIGTTFEKNIAKRSRGLGCHVGARLVVKVLRRRGAVGDVPVCPQLFSSALTKTRVE